MSLKRFVVVGIKACPKCPDVIIGHCEFSDIAKELRDMVVVHGEDVWDEIYVLDAETGEHLHRWSRK